MHDFRGEKVDVRKRQNYPRNPANFKNSFHARKSKDRLLASPMKGSCGPVYYQVHRRILPDSLLARPCKEVMGQSVIKSTEEYFGTVYDKVHGVILWDSLLSSLLREIVNHSIIIPLYSLWCESFYLSGGGISGGNQELFLVSISSTILPLISFSLDPPPHHS